MAICDGKLLLCLIVACVLDTMCQSQKDGPLTSSVTEDIEIGMLVHCSLGGFIKKRLSIQPFFNTFSQLLLTLSVCHCLDH